MNVNTGIGRTGVALAAIVACAMCVLSLLFHPVEISPIQYGLCLPSPDSWDFDPFVSWIVNTGIIGLITILLWLINKGYNFIRTTEPVFFVLFMIMASSTPWFTQNLNTSVILCLANVVSLGIIFASYGSRNATQQMFLLGVVAGIGSMFQYAFLPMACVYFLWALFMKVLRLRELLAFFAGIICPYWIAIGIGWLSISEIKFPSLTPLFGITRDHSDFFFLLGGIAVAATLGFLVALINSMKLYAGNSKVNAMNICVSTLGAASVICILVDYDNMLAYVVSLYVASAAQVANICALWNPRMPWLVSVLPSALYIALFAGTMLL